jgi:hypothetical protein
MWCKKCGYALDGLSEKRCPECGREFDPDRKRTFLKKPYRVGRFFTVVAVVSLLLAVLGSALWVGSYWYHIHIVRGIYTTSVAKAGGGKSELELYDSWMQSINGYCKFHLERRSRPRDLTGATWRYEATLDIRSNPLPQQAWGIRPQTRISLSHISLPYISLVFSFIVLTAIWLYRYRRARWMRGIG